MQKIDRTGEQNYNISGYLMTIVKYENSRKIYVRFENGFENIGTYQSFKKGSVYVNGKIVENGLGKD